MARPDDGRPGYPLGVTGPTTRADQHPAGESRRPPPHPARVQPARVVALLRADPDRIAVGDTATLRCTDELLRLLMSRHRAAAEPLGRAIHPMTTVPVGLAIDAAIEAAGGYLLEVTTLRYATFSMEAPTSNRRPLVATARVEAIGDRHVDVTCVVSEGARTILTGRFGLVRVVRGRAARLSDRAIASGGTESDPHVGGDPPSAVTSSAPRVPGPPRAARTSPCTVDALQARNP